ncbi:MAG: hypothetical protein R3194_04920, partial [Limnobacter sp.]|nr:hypothetical protein [Limnobacter sp.]
GATDEARALLTISDKATPSFYELGSLGLSILSEPTQSAEGNTPDPISQFIANLSQEIGGISTFQLDYLSDYLTLDNSTSPSQSSTSSGDTGQSWSSQFDSSSYIQTHSADAALAADTPQDI